MTVIFGRLAYILFIANMLLISSLSFGFNFDICSDSARMDYLDLGDASLDAKSHYHASAQTSPSNSADSVPNHCTRHCHGLHFSLATQTTGLMDDFGSLQYLEAIDLENPEPIIDRPIKPPI